MRAIAGMARSYSDAVQSPLPSVPGSATMDSGVTADAANVVTSTSRRAWMLGAGNTGASSGASRKQRRWLAAMS